MRMLRRIIIIAAVYGVLFALLNIFFTSVWSTMPDLLFFIAVFVLPAVIIFYAPKLRSRLAKKCTEKPAETSEDAEPDDVVETSLDSEDGIDREDALNEKEKAIAAKEEALQQWLEQAREKETQLKSDVKYNDSLLMQVKRERSAAERVADEIQQYRIALEKTEQRVFAWVKLREAEDLNYFDELRKDVERFEKFAEISPDMDGFKFEEYVAKILMDNGYTEVSVTQKSRDFGADVTASYGDARYVLQCKYYTHPVGIEAVQQVYASKSVYSAHVAVVVTNSVFTKAAKILAEEVGVLLWDGEKLSTMSGGSNAN